MLAGAIALLVIAPTVLSNKTAPALPPGFRDVVILGTNSIRLERSSSIISGDVVVNDASRGPTLSSQVELRIDRDVTTPAGFSLKADSIRIERGADIGGDVFHNELRNKGTIRGSLSSPLPLPVFGPLPEFLTGVPGGNDISVRKNRVVTLGEGAYRDIKVEKRGTVVFTGGVYTVRSGPRKGPGFFSRLKPR